VERGVTLIDTAEMYPVNPLSQNTQLSQLEQALDAVDLVLADEVLAAIQAVYRQHPVPFYR